MKNKNQMFYIAKLSSNVNEAQEQCKNWQENKDRN